MPLSEMKKIFGPDADEWNVFEAGYRRDGSRGACRAYAAYLLRLREKQQQAVSPYALASAYASAGDRDSTMEWLEWLEKCYAARLPMLLHVTTDPAFDSVRDNPRFKALLERIGFRGRKSRLQGTGYRLQGRTEAGSKERRAGRRAEARSGKRE